MSVMGGSRIRVRDIVVTLLGRKILMAGFSVVRRRFWRLDFIGSPGNCCFV
jgi:hypothetical protein